ncbi:MAG TPA: hypothetical protein VJL32_03915 [Candidatus Paceibacterota bacterium]
MFTKVAVESTENYQTFKLTTQRENILRAKYIRSRLPGKKKTIIVFPLYGVNEIPVRWFVDYLTEMNRAADFNVIYLQEGHGDDPLDLDAFLSLKTGEELLTESFETVRRFERAIDGIRDLLDWSRQESAIDQRAIGIIGFSTSALVASVAMAVEPRISAGVIFLGGGNIHEMFAEGSEPRISAIRKNFSQSTGKPATELAKILKINWSKIDPLSYASVLDPAKILYFDSEHDEYIPKSGRDEFWKRADQPTRITFQHSHKWSFLALTPLWFYYANQKIVNFFRKTFSARSAP